MSSGTLILELLDDVKPEARCDDCLSDELAIRPRQTVNQLCRLLAAENRIARSKAKCVACGKQKICNSASSATSNLDSSPKSKREIEARFDIEKCRTEVVRICNELWRAKKSDGPPRSISQLINTLRNDGLLPSHPANMMLTLCGLRNVYVYEGLEFSEREVVIAKAAHEVLRDWWTKTKGGTPPIQKDPTTR
jgi:hypothetical protein